MTSDIIVIKNFFELTTSELYEILKARFALFAMEQNVSILTLTALCNKSSN